MATNSDGNTETTTTRLTTGLLASLRRLLAASTEVLRTRLEIFSVELEEEGVRVRELFFLVQVSLFFLGVGLLLATLFILLIFWDSHRLTALAAFAALYLVAGIGTTLVLRHKLRSRPRFLGATMAELSKDRDHLISRS